jgi:hypothetical protein
MNSGQNTKRIVCLANSRKPEGRCIAGKQYDAGKFGSWLRPISNRSGEELSQSERTFSSGKEPALLDIVELSVTQHQPSGHQPENFLIDSNTKFKHLGQVNMAELIKVVDKPINLWVMGFQSKTYGKNDLVPPDKISEVTNSLFLINPHSFKIQVAQGPNSRQVRGIFEYVGAEYNLRITDPLIEAKYLSYGLGEHEIDDVLLTISLAEKLWNVPSNPSSSGYYKLIAGVIDISNMGNR